MIAGIQGATEELRVSGKREPTPTTPVANESEADWGRLRDELMEGVGRLTGSGRVSTQAAAEGCVAHFLETRLPSEPLPPKGYVGRLLRDLVPHCVNMNSPRALGHMSGWQPPWVRVIGEVVLALNQNMVKHEASRSFTLLERQVLGTLHRLVFERSDGFYEECVQNPSRTLGIMAAGSTVANITALWVARNRAFGGANSEATERSGIGWALRREGLRAGVIVGSSLMHYSIDKAAGVLGLGTNQVLKLGVDPAQRLMPKEVRRTIRETRERGRQVVAIVGTAGTTDCGSIDPIAALADIAKEEGIHFHVDAAWGTALLFSRRHRSRLEGIERADTVTLDGHKQLHLPAGSNLLLCRDPAAAGCIEKEAPYMLHRDSFDLGRRSLEGSRPACALYLHAALNLMGRQGYERLIDRRIETAGTMARMIREMPEFELLAEPETNIVVYRRLPARAGRTASRNGSTPFDLPRINEHNAKLQRAQERAGDGVVSRTTLHHTARHPGLPVLALRAVITHPATGDAEVRFILEDQAAIGASLDQVDGER